MAHPDAAGAAIADGAAAAAGLVGLEPELLVASLIFLDHVAAVRTGEPTNASFFTGGGMVLGCGRPELLLASLAGVYAPA